MSNISKHNRSSCFWLDRRKIKLKLVDTTKDRQSTSYSDYKMKYYVQQTTLENFVRIITISR